VTDWATNKRKFRTWLYKFFLLNILPLDSVICGFVWNCI